MANEGSGGKLMRPPNIVLVIVCTFVYDHLTPSGYERETTPFLDSLARRGAYFENAVSASSWTQPTVTSILTGLTPNVHQMTLYLKTRDVAQRSTTPERLLSDEIVTLAECLKNAGYDTFGRINNVQAGHFFNIPQGFDDGETANGKDTAAFLRDWEDWLRARDSCRPFFALIMTRDPHSIYQPAYETYVRFNRSDGVVAQDDYASYPRSLHGEVGKLVSQGVPEDLQRKYVDLYDGELADLDAALAGIPGILENAGCADDTVLTIIGDHGERFFKHGKIGHGWHLDEEIVHVPLIMTGPGVAAGRRIKDVVRSIDVYPTLADLAGATPPELLQGRSLRPLMGEKPGELPPASAYATFTRGEVTLKMVRSQSFKLHASGSPFALYDLAHDPDERQNLLATETDRARSLHHELQRWLAQEEDLRGRIGEGATRELTPEVVEQLRALGYVD